MKKFFIIFSIFIQFSTIALASDDTVVCEQDQSLPASMPEIFSLLATVKNDILGTVPRFCRKGEYQQLADSNPGEKELSDFVDMVSKLKIPNAKDTAKVDEKSETKIDGIIFTTLKTVALKKIWHQASDNVRYNILVNNSCNSLGLNRFPIHSKKKKGESSKELDVKLLERAKKACKSSSFADIAPFITKDVLAESMVHLKNLFPESFPAITDALCESLIEVDETLFKDDSFKDLYAEDKSIESAKEFSDWLKELYATFNSSKETAKEQEMITKKISETYTSSTAGTMAGGGYGYSMSKMILDYQKQLEEMYKMQESNPEYSKMLGSKISKSKSGIFVSVVDEEQQKKLAEQVEKMKEQQKKTMASAIEDQQNKQLTKMKSVYEAGQPAEMVPVPGMQNVFLKKDEAGEIVFVVSDDIKEEMKQSIELNKKANEKMKKDMLDMMEKTYSTLKQDDLKQLFEIQNAYKEFDSASNFTSMYQMEISVDENGVYKAKYVASASMQMYGGYYGYDSSVYKDLYEDTYKKVKIEGLPKVIISLENPSWMSAMSEDGQLMMVATPTKALKSGGLFPTGAWISAGWPSDTSSKATDEAVSEEEKKVVPKTKIPVYSNGLPLGEAIKKKYQTKSATPAKIETLTADELASLRSYTGSSYASLNGCLRAENCSEDQKKKVDLIQSALSKVRSDSVSKEDYQIIYRGTRDMPDSIYKSLTDESESMVLDKGFMSATAELNIAQGFSGSSVDSLDSKRSVFIMKTKSCVGISNLSNFQGEDEFLCPPGLKFKAKKKEDSNNVFILEEIVESK